MQYKVIYASDSESFGAQLNEFAEQGWILDKFQNSVGPAGYISLYGVLRKGY